MQRVQSVQRVQRVQSVQRRNAEALNASQPWQWQRQWQREPYQRARAAGTRLW